MGRALFVVSLIAATTGSPRAPKSAPTAPKSVTTAPKASTTSPKSPPKVTPTAPRPAAPKPPPAPPPTAKVARPPAPAPAASSSPAQAPEPAPSAPGEASSTPARPDDAAPAPAPIAPTEGRPAAPPAPPPASIVVDFERPASGAWFVEGLEQVVEKELLRFHDVALAKKIDPGRCPGRVPRCLVDHYRAAGVDVVISGALSARGALAYQVYDTWTGTRAFDGALPLSNASMATFERETGDIVRPIVRRGGLLDQRPPVAVAVAAPTLPPQARTTIAVERLSLLIAAMILLVASPMLLLLSVVGTRELARRPTPASWKWSAAIVTGLAAIPIAANLLDLPSVIARAAVGAPRLAGLAPPILAGALWGVFAVAVFEWVLAPIRGLERVRHDALWPLLRSWLALALLRAVALAAIDLPVLAYTARTCDQIGVAHRATMAFALPAAGLLVHFALLSLVDNLSVYLDTRLVVGFPSPRNAWHVTMKRYVRGYVRRQVIDVGDALLERTLFLPGVRPGIVSYGGGFARPRIVVGEKTIEAALGELPDEEELPDRTVNAEEQPMGIVIPALDASASDAQLARGEQRRRALTAAPVRARGYVPRLLGERATLLGWVLPQRAEAASGVPLLSNTEEDFGVVKGLLTEHYAAFQGLDDDEVDDTDPTQKDFLFGALLREIGIAARRDTAFATIFWSVDVACASRSWLARLARLPITLYERLLAAPAAKVADAYAALNGGLHPLLQHLAFQRGIDEHMLTARANVPRLALTSRLMLARLEQDETKLATIDHARAAARERAAWVTKHFDGAALPSRVRWPRVAGAVAVTALTGALLARSVIAAVAYHPMYVERMERMKSQASAPTDPTHATQGDHVR